MDLLLLLFVVVLLLVACCRLALLLGREREATERLRWKLLGRNLELKALQAGREEEAEEEWPEIING